MSIKQFFTQKELFKVASEVYEKKLNEAIKNITNDKSIMVKLKNENGFKILLNINLHDKILCNVKGHSLNIPTSYPHYGPDKRKNIDPELINVELSFNKIKKDILNRYGLQISDSYVDKKCLIYITNNKNDVKQATKQHFQNTLFPINRNNTTIISTPVKQNSNNENVSFEDFIGGEGE